MGRILIIEDSPNIRKLIRRILETDGYTVIEAESGAEGTRLVSSESPDCVILDLIMPDMTGMTILTESLDGSKIPVVVVTAHIQDSVSDQCMKSGAAAVVSKPFTKDELLYAVKKALSSKASLAGEPVSR